MPADSLASIEPILLALRDNLPRPRTDPEPHTLQRPMQLVLVHPRAQKPRELTVRRHRQRTRDGGSVARDERVPSRAYVEEVGDRGEDGDEEEGAGEEVRGERVHPELELPGLDLSAELAVFAHEVD